MSDALLEVADELYGLPLARFTPERDARAKTLKADGEPDLAAEVKALRKPSLAAWVVDLFVRRAADQVGQVLEMGAALREAQAGMSGEDLRALTRQRRQLTAALTQEARSLASEEGVRVTPSVADQVEATLTAAMVSQDCGAAVRSGLLVTALSTTGLDDVDLAAAVAVPEALGFTATARAPVPPGKPDLHVVPDPDAAAKVRAEAEETLADAVAEVERAETEMREASDAVEGLRARQLQIEAEIDELKRRIAALESDCDDVDDELSEAETGLEEARDAVANATSARDAAAAALEAVGRRG